MTMPISKAFSSPLKTKKPSTAMKAATATATAITTSTANKNHDNTTPISSSSSSLFTTQHKHDPISELMSTAPVSLFRNFSDGQRSVIDNRNNSCKVVYSSSSTTEEQLHRLEELSFQEQEVMLKKASSLTSNTKNGSAADGVGDGISGNDNCAGVNYNSDSIQKRSSTPNFYGKIRSIKSESFDFINVSQLNEMNRKQLKQLEELGLTVKKEEAPLRRGSASSDGSDTSGPLTRRKSIE
jgi:hypothetical protein